MSMRIKTYLFLLLIIPLFAFPDGQTSNHASRIRTTTTNFDNNLSAADTDVQKALDTLDDMTVGAGDMLKSVYDVDDDGIIDAGKFVELDPALTTHESTYNHSLIGTAWQDTSESITIGDGSATPTINFDGDGGTDGSIVWDVTNDMFSTNAGIGIGISDFDGTPAIGKLMAQASTNDGSTNALVLRDSDGANVVTVDSDGLATIPQVYLGSSTGVSATAASGFMTLGGVGNTNNENLTFNFESTSNVVGIGSSSGVSAIRIADLIGLGFGTSFDSKFIWQTAGNDSLQLGLTLGSANDSGYVSIMDQFDLGNANRSPLATSANPVLRIYSEDQTQANDYIEFYHDQTDANIASGNGDINLIPAGGDVNVTGNVVPEADGTRNLGTQTTAQWANVWADAVNGADYTYLNKWRTLEAEKYEGFEPGIAFDYCPGLIAEDGSPILYDVMPNNKKPIFVVTENSIYFQGTEFTKENLLWLKFVMDYWCWFLLAVLIYPVLLTMLSARWMKIR